MSHDSHPYSAESPRLVLIVDDCRMTRRLLAMYVQQAGYEPIVAENGLDALEKLGREPCSIIVTDLNMPQMDGVELIHALRAHPLYNRIPVILLTTQGEEEERRNGLAAGATAFLTKPITQSALIREIERASRHDQEALSMAVQDLES
ncbi:MAG: response regulator [Nitrospirae bacterium]|nr:MAG: response regulator [Nitrospirota bacterium]